MRMRTEVKQADIKSANGTVFLKKSLTDVYIVESYKEFNYQNTDRSMGDERTSNISMGLSLM